MFLILDSAVEFSAKRLERSGGTGTLFNDFFSHVHTGQIISQRFDRIHLDFVLFFFPSSADCGSPEQLNTTEIYEKNPWSSGQ